MKGNQKNNNKKIYKRLKLYIKNQTNSTAEKYEK